jgi:hypothetical protein
MAEYVKGKVLTVYEQPGYKGGDPRTWVQLLSKSLRNDGGIMYDLVNFVNDGERSFHPGEVVLVPLRAAESKKAAKVYYLTKGDDDIGGLGISPEKE